MPLKKRGLFFILDAAIALFVLIIGVVLIAASYLNAPEPSQVGFLADDLLNFLSDTKIKELNNPYAGIGGILWQNGTISDADNSLLQQTGYFYSRDDFDTAEKFIQNATKEVVPSQFRYEVWINSTLIYPRYPAQEHITSKDNTGLLLTSKKITFGIMNKTTSDIWGPYKAEVFLWER